LLQSQFQIIYCCAGKRTKRTKQINESNGKNAD
jgi:hypothetical protein